MKKIIIITCALVIGLLPARYIVAETQTETQPAPTRQNILRERLEKQRQNYIQNLQEARAITEKYRTTTNLEDKQKLQTQTRQSFTLRLTNVVEKLEEIQSKISLRIITAQQQGINVDQAQEKLTLSQNHLTIVSLEQEKLQSLFLQNEKTDLEETAQESFLIIKENLTISQNALLDSMQILKQQTIISPKETINIDTVLEN